MYIGFWRERRIAVFSVFIRLEYDMDFLNDQYRSLHIYVFTSAGHCLFCRPIMSLIRLIHSADLELGMQFLMDEKRKFLKSCYTDKQVRVFLFEWNNSRAKYESYRIFLQRLYRSTWNDQTGLYIMRRILNRTVSEPARWN